MPSVAGGSSRSGGGAHRVALAFALFAGTATGCGKGAPALTQVPLDAASDVGAADATVGPVQALFIVPASLDDLSGVHYYDHPWPSDLRRDPGGAVHFAGLYNPYDVVLIQDYLQASVGLLDGFSPAASAYFRFTGDIDPTTLPQTPPASVLPTSSVQIIDIDPSSPEHGSRRLAELYWQQADGVYWLHDTLAVSPALGYPLRRNNQYAIVITNAVHDTLGNPIQPSSDLTSVLSAPTTRTQAVHDMFAPAVAELATLGVATSQIAHMTVFTTNDPTSELYAIRDDMRKNQPAPAADPTMWTRMMQTATFDVYQGWYGPVPNYQAGTAPYMSTGGNFVFDASGNPVVQNTSSMRFTLVVPNATACPPPKSGYPINLYATGTGGDYESVIDDTGTPLAPLCVAAMGVDEIFEGARPGAPPASDPNLEGDEDLLFYNLNNPIAARTNGRQSALDVVTQARLFTDSHLTVPASVSTTGKAIAFDATNMGFFGHSEGSLSGSMFLAADDQVRGAVLSGSGSMITITLLEKTLPAPSVAEAVKTILELTRNLPDGGNTGSELNLFHPVVNFVQALVDATDPVHYVGDIFQHPRAGLSPKSVYQTEGVFPDGTGDSYAPPHGIEVGAVATGLPLQAPGIHPIVEAPWGGLGNVTVPAAGLSGNVGGGLASGILAQFEPPPGDDGHFVVFDVPQAQAQAAGFCQSLATTPHGKIPALQ